MMFRNGSEIFVSCSAISDDLDDSSSNSTIHYGLQLPKAHVFDRGPSRVKTTVIRWRRDSREVVRHAHRLDLTCRQFLNRAVKIKEPFGSAPMTLELRGLIATLRRAAYAIPPGENRATPVGPVVPVRPKKGHRVKRAREKEALPDSPDESSEVGSMERAQKTQRGPTLRSRSQTQSPGLWARPVSVVVPDGRVQRAPNVSTGFLALNNEIDSPSHRRRRRAHEGTNSVSSNSPSSGLPPPLRVLGEGTSQAVTHETSSWRFSYDDEVPVLVNLKGCELPTLDDMRERNVYVQMAVTNAKTMEASNEYVALMEKRLADFPSKEEVGVHLLTIQQLQGELEAVQATEKQREVEIEGAEGQTDLDSMRKKHRREIKGCKAAALKEHSLAQYDAVLAVVKDKLRMKKEGTAAEIPRIEALTEYSEGGFEVEEELVRIKDREISLDLDYDVSSVSDLSLSRIDLPEVSVDLVMFRNGSEISVSCSAISDDLDDSSSNSTIHYGLHLPKAHVFDCGPLRYYPKLGPTSRS
ncbi:LOW QUALITY PROTEIN: hypothetical protein HID58_041178 [Brassica napus]|uniref:Uncharacterized protein n=1 Tax=Brassica napus TaxID=3708 RepID=A0ABQ8BBN9_BRANA|nr:LOW QUALITY PROTEIN: hypothetical protein HID58_041178 [Brassica napus]